MNQQMQILAAPIQEYTDVAFRNAHCNTIGGIDEYYTPFIRLENNSISKRSAVDIAPANQHCTNVVPQILVKDKEETRRLISMFENMDYKRVDINLGCPFPKVVKSGYGAGMLAKPQDIREVLTEACQNSKLQISVKMRLGIDNPATCLELLPIFNAFSLANIVLHARTAVQQYNGMPDIGAFKRFMEKNRNVVIYNGDICNDTNGMDKIMIGRGLLANPLLPRQLRNDKIDGLCLLQQFHTMYIAECRQLYQQPLLKLKLLWEYLLPNSDKRLRKAIQKSRTMDEYLSVTEELLGQTLP